MKKNNLLLTFILSVFLFVGCSDDKDSVRICADFIATVVSDVEGAYLVELDGGVKYYSSAVLNHATTKPELGDRLYFRYFEINYDKQAPGADGSKSNPYEITCLVYEKMDIYTPVSSSDEEAGALPSDELRFFFAPYLEQTTIERNYLNFTYVIPHDSEPKLNLIYTGTKQDTLCYEFKVSYTKNEDNRQEDCYIETFELENLPAKGAIRINFNAQNYDQRSKGFLSDSVFVLPFELNKTF